MEGGGVQGEREEGAGRNRRAESWREGKVGFNVGFLKVF